MHTQIRRVGVGLLAAFIAVFLQLNYVQIYAANDIAGNNANIRSLIKEYSIKRGDILTEDGELIATSQATDGRFKYRRTYPMDELMAHITGYYSLLYGTARVENTFNDVLLGDSGVISMQDIQDRLFGAGERGDDVVVTIDSELQRAARDALGNNSGAVVAIDPNDGRIRAMWSNPTYDPNPLASFNGREARRHRRSLDPQSPSSPLVALATSRSFPPGSTFKVVTAAAALESGRFDPDSTFDDPVELELPQTTSTISNFSGGTCAGGGQISLFDALRVSCNTTFGELGLRVPGELARVSEALGFNADLPFDVGLEASSFIRADEDNLPRRALAGIGQGDVAATPVQMALVAAAVANGGEVPRPRLVREVLDSSGGIVNEPAPETLGRAFSQGTANQLREMMIAVIESGTGANAQMEGTEVAGKTGTAQSAEGADPHAWFIAFAPANDPQLAVAVFVQNGGSFGAEATGGTVAAPMARQVFETDRDIRGW